MNTSIVSGESPIPHFVHNTLPTQGRQAPCPLTAPELALTLWLQFHFCLWLGYTPVSSPATSVSLGEVLVLGLFVINNISKLDTEPQETLISPLLCSKTLGFSPWPHS